MSLYGAEEAVDGGVAGLEQRRDAWSNNQLEPILDAATVKNEDCVGDKESVNRQINDTPTV